MKDPKEMTDEELYQYLRARKVRLQVVQEMSTAYTTQSIIITSLYNPVHGVTKASINKSSSVTRDYTRVKIEDIIEEMESRRLDFKRYDDDKEINALAQKWISAWKSAKVLGTIVGLDLAEINDIIELCNDMGDIITDFGELAEDIGGIASDIGDMITESANNLGILQISNDIGEAVNNGNEILVDVVDVIEDVQDMIDDMNDDESGRSTAQNNVKKDVPNPEVMTTTSDNNVSKGSADNVTPAEQTEATSVALTYEAISAAASNAASAMSLQMITNQIVQMKNKFKIDEKLKKIPAPFYSNDENNSSIPDLTTTTINAV